MENILSILYSGLCIFIIFMFVRSDFKKIKNTKKYYDNKRNLEKKERCDKNDNEFI